MQRKILGIVDVDLDIKLCYQSDILIHQILGKNWEYGETVHELFVDFKKAFDSVWRKVLCNILTEFGNPMKVVRLIKV